MSRIRIFILLVLGLMVNITTSAQVSSARYALYQSGDGRSFLLLDTSTGLIQLYSPRKITERSPKGYMYLPQHKLTGFINRVKLNNDMETPGRFSIKKNAKENLFILTDTTDGRCWEVHYGGKTADRYLVRITE